MGDRVFVKLYLPQEVNAAVEQMREGNPHMSRPAMLVELLRRGLSDYRKAQAVWEGKTQVDVALLRSGEPSHAE